MTSVKELMENYETGGIPFPQLLTALASCPISPAPRGQDWGQVYARAEEAPDDNSFFWVEAAELSDALTEDQVEQIAAAHPDL